MSEHLRVIILGVSIYVFPTLSRWLAARWFALEYSSLKNPDFDTRAHLMRQRFWRGTFWVIFAVGIGLLSAWAWQRSLDLSLANWLRIIAASMALVASLGRAGYAIQTWKQETVMERIDRGMHVFGQLGAVAFLVFAFTL